MFLLLAFVLCLSLVHAQSACSLGGVGTATQPVTIRGFIWDSVAQDLRTPRGITFDKIGRLLVVSSGVGIIAMQLSNETCSQVTKAATIVANSQLNHGIEFSVDGTTLYASSSQNVFAWNYNITTGAVSNVTTIVTGMGETSHSTRTLHIPPLHPNLLVVTRGSNGNIDPSAATPDSGHSQAKVFDLTTIPEGGHDFNTGGGILAYGVRNEVGITSDANGHIWGVMNSADQLQRNGTTISNDNPAEELHYCPFPPSSLLNFSSNGTSRRSNRSTNVILRLPQLLHSLGPNTLLPTPVDGRLLDPLPKLNLQRHNLQRPPPKTPSLLPSPLRPPRHQILLPQLPLNLLLLQRRQRIRLLPLYLDRQRHRLLPRLLE